MKFIALLLPAFVVRMLARAIGKPIASLLALACLVPSIAGAAGLEIDPVRFDFSPQQQSGAITLRNDSDKPKTIQIETVAWSHRGGSPFFSPTRDLAVSHPAVTLAPNAEQTIHVTLKRKPDAASELSYRINLRENFAQPPKGNSGLRVTMRIGVPVFVQPRNGIAAPKLSWSVLRAPDKNLLLILRNEGNAHVEVSDVALRVPGAVDALAGEQRSTYILAGQSYEWLLKTNPAQTMTGGSLLLKAITDAGTIETALPLATP